MPSPTVTEITESCEAVASRVMSWAARLGGRPIWDPNRDHSRLRLHPVAAASCSTRACPRLVTICSQAKATSGSAARPAWHRRASAAWAMANQSSQDPAAHDYVSFLKPTWLQTISESCALGHLRCHDFDDGLEFGK